MHTNLLPFLQFPLRTLDELCLRPHGVVISGPSEGSAQARYFASGFVNGDDVAGDDFLFGQAFDHFLPEVVDGLHLRRFQSQFAHLGAGAWKKKTGRQCNGGGSNRE